MLQRCIWVYAECRHTFETVDVMKLDVPNSNTAFMLWVIFIIKGNSGFYLGMTVGKSMICRGQDI